MKNASLKKLLLSWNDQFEDYKEEENRLQSWGTIHNEIYLNEPALYRKRDVKFKLSDEAKIKLEKVIIGTRVDLGIVLSKWKINQESKELMTLLDSIISLTESHAKEMSKSTPDPSMEGN